MTNAGEITRQLEAIRRGEREAEAQLAELVYEELHARARQYMRKERADHTLQPTALVHEAFLKLMRGRDIEWQGRAHFLAVASMVMRRILVDHARKRRAAKRPAGQQQVDLAEYHATVNPRIEQVLMLDEALTRLAAMDARQGKLVELMYFGGLTEGEAGEVLGISVRTVKRDWTSARAWLQSQLRRGSS